MDTTASATEPTTTLLRLSSVSVAFGGLLALGGIDLDVAQGERLAVLGPNGAGKTTLFNVVAGDIRPTSGSVWIKGVDSTLLPSRRRPSLGVARTYQRTRLFPGLTVEDNLYLAVVGRHGRHRSLRRTPIDEQWRIRARDAARAVWLGDRLESAVGDLSHGEQRQLEVGMAVVTNPDLMMLDEPASGLSRGERERLVELLDSLAADVTLLLIEHDMDVALRVARSSRRDGRRQDHRRRHSRRDPRQQARPRRVSRKRDPLMSESLLQVRDLCAGYGASRVLDGVSFDIGVEAVAIIGRNGMGKTTLCDTIMGLVRATSGEVVFDDERIDNHVPEKIAKRGISYVPQGRRLFPLADRRRAPDDAGQGHARQALDARIRVRVVPTPRRTPSQRRGPVVGRRAADARGRRGRCSSTVRWW